MKLLIISGTPKTVELTFSFVTYKQDAFVYSLKKMLQMNRIRDFDNE